MTTNVSWTVRGVAVATAALALACSGEGASVRDGTSGSSGPSGSSDSTSPSGSSGSSGSQGGHGEALFDAPSGAATPDSIFGVWGGTKHDGRVTFDTRMRLSPKSATFATRCAVDGSTKTSPVVGVTVAARITDDSFVLTESRSDEDASVVRCAVSVSPREVKRCAADVPKGFESNCFTIEGSRFTDFGASSFDTFELTKLSD
jgi:hypothetical protein